MENYYFHALYSSICFSPAVVHDAKAKCANRALYQVLHKLDVTDEERSINFAGAESLVNSKPRTYQSAETTDTTILQLLQGQEFVLPQKL